MRLDDREKKLILLAFDPAASTGETVNAVNALALRWMRKYQDGHELIQDLEGGEPEIRKRVVYRTQSPFAGVVLGFGKYKGRRLDEVDPTYLLWVLENFEDLWPQTREAIERYLNQSG
jgi:hypothetical protein